MKDNLVKSRKITCVLCLCPSYPTSRNIFQRYIDKMSHKSALYCIIHPNYSAFLVSTTLSWPHHGWSTSPPLTLGLTMKLTLNDIVQMAGCHNHCWALRDVNSK